MGIVTSCLNASSRQLLTAAADGDAETVRQVLVLLLAQGLRCGVRCGFCAGEISPFSSISLRDTAARVPRNAMWNRRLTCDLTANIV